MKRLIRLLALFALFLPGLATELQANPMTLTVEFKADGASSYSIEDIIDDGGTGNLTYFNDAVGGGVIVNFTTGESYPPLIDPTVLARLLLHSTNIENTGAGAAGSVRVTLTRSYFAVSSALASAAATVTVDGAATASLQSWVTHNSGSGTQTTNLYTPTFTVVGSDTQHIDGATHLFASGASPFWLTSQLTVDFAGAGVAYTTDASAAVTQVPEPASLFLIGSGLLGLVSARRRHSKRNESTSV